MNSTSSATIADLFASLDPQFLASHPDMRQSEGASLPERLRAVDFLGNVRSLELDTRPITLQDPAAGRSSVKSLTSKFAIDSLALTASDRSFWDYPARAPVILKIQPGQQTAVDSVGIGLVLFLAYILTRTFFRSFLSKKRDKLHGE